MLVKKAISSLAVMAMLAGTLLVPVNSAFARDYYNYGNRYSTSSRIGDYMYDHSYVKKAAIGGGAGAVLGAVLGQEGSRVDGALKGALLGAGAGLGYEYLRRQGVFSW
jgi:hypothetical protein